jgi:eukaryotic-like serine/threonine-protein kinase
MSLEGSQIGRFRLLRPLGRGGMGEVYLAEDDQLRRHVAIKVIQAEYPDPDAIRLFQREARAIAMLNHRHILPLFDFGEATIHGTILTYMVMPFCKEDTLAAWMQQRRNTFLLFPHNVGFIVEQAASALQYAHNHQIVHQDVKPSNFLIRNSEDASGRPDLMLADFGVAKSNNTTASVSQSVRGTPAYMAPEQWEGTPVPATDQYALAIMTYDLLTGHPPFQGGLGQVMYQHLHVTPQPPGKLNPRIPADVDTVILQALAKKPEERFGSISAFARAFEQALPVDNSSPTKANTSHEPGRRDIHTALVISETEAQTGTHRILTLLGGRQVPVTVPANAYNEQVLNFPNLGEPSPSGGSAGDLIVTLSIEQEQTPLTTPPQPQPKINVPQAGDSQPKGDITDIPIVNAPPPNNQSSAKRNQRTIAIASGIVLVVLVLALVFYAVSRSGSNAGNGTVTVNATATIIAQNPDPYPPMNRTLALADSLSDNSHGYSWSEAGDSLGNCAFTGGAYHVNAIQPNNSKGCIASSDVPLSNFSDFAYQVQMTIVKGDRGGILIRDDTKGNGYYFFIDQNGNYGFGTYSNCPGNNCKLRPSRNTSNIAAIKTGLNQSNLVAVVAHGSTIDLYVNHHGIDSVSDSSYSQGHIGVFARDENNPTEVVFSNAKVWT